MWEGDRIVAELRGDGSGGAIPDLIELPGPGGVVDGDAPWGRVQYIHALGSAASGGIDMPVRIERSSVYGDGARRAPDTGRSKRGHGLVVLLAGQPRVRDDWRLWTAVPVQPIL